MFRSQFEKEIIRFDLSGFKLSRSDEDLFKDNTQMLDLSQLNRQTDTLWMKYNGRLGEYKEQLFKKLMYGRDSMRLSEDGDVWLSTMTGERPTGPDPQPEDEGTARKPPSLNPSVRMKQQPTTDTIMAVNVAAVPDNWSFLDGLPPADQVKAIEGAMNLTRSSKTYVSSMINEFGSRMKTIKRHGVEWHRKFTLSFACIVLFFIGAPLGAIIRKGGLGMPVVVSVILFIVFHVLNITGEKMAKHGDLEPWQGMWMASLVLTPIGIYLTWKATTDSPVMDADTWSKPVRAIAKLFKRSKKSPTQPQPQPS